MKKSIELFNLPLKPLYFPWFWVLPVLLLIILTHIMYFIDVFQVPFATSPNHLIIPMAGLGFGIGMVDSSMMPQLGFLVDIRHSAVYGGVYAIGDIAFCMGFAVGKCKKRKKTNQYFFSYSACFKRNGTIAM